jgi:hypothetical protein
MSHIIPMCDIIRVKIKGTMSSVIPMPDIIVIRKRLKIVEPLILFC